jgi:predicted hotdog family 3-hydroxylacyl-ACP dehydratase
MRTDDMPIDRAWIEAHIPHRGRMCLLDEVLDWSAAGIRCRSTTHRAADHPLRAHGRLSAACGIEYAAQAMAVHGALITGASADGTASGYLASVRGVMFGTRRLDEVRADLICTAQRVAGDQDTIVYDFVLFEQANDTAAAPHLLSGRASIFLSAPAQFGKSQAGKP